MELFYRVHEDLSCNTDFHHCKVMSSTRGDKPPRHQRANTTPDTRRKSLLSLLFCFAFFFVPSFSVSSAPVLGATGRPKSFLHATPPPRWRWRLLYDGIYFWPLSPPGFRSQKVGCCRILGRDKGYLFLLLRTFRNSRAAGARCVRLLRDNKRFYSALQRAF